MTDCPLFFNSHEVTEEFKKRYHYFLNKNRVVECLNIGHPPIKQLERKKAKDEINNIAVYGNFLFFESEYGLNTLIDELKKSKKTEAMHTNLFIFGKNSLEIFGEYDGLSFGGVKFFVLGMVDSVESVLQTCDSVMIPVDVTGGLKIKLLESLCYGLSVVTTNNVAKHLKNYESLNQIKTFDSIEDIAKNLESIDIKDNNNQEIEKNLPQWYDHYTLIQELFSNE